MTAATTCSGCETTLRTGGPAFVLGLLSTLLLATASYAGVAFLS
jgi:hypothetical protein